MFQRIVRVHRRRRLATLLAPVPVSLRVPSPLCRTIVLAIPLLSAIERSVAGVQRILLGCGSNAAQVRLFMQQRRRGRRVDFQDAPSARRRQALRMIVSRATFLSSSVSCPDR